MEENNQTEVLKVEEVKEKVYKFRKLNASDIPLMLSILKKINLSNFAECFGSETVKKIMQENEGDNNLDIITGGAIFLEVAQVVISGMSDCMDEVFKMLSNTSNLSLSDVKALDLNVFTEMVIDFIKKEEIVGFIKDVSKLIK